VAAVLQKQIESEATSEDMQRARMFLQDFRKQIRQVRLLHKNIFKENRMNTYNKTDIEQAEKIISEYLESNYKWKYEEYELSVYSEESSAIITFLVYHNDDRNPTQPGGGKSLLIKMDMEKMVVVQELGFQ
jgi:hypothetical protein